MTSPVPRGDHLLCLLACLGRSRARDLIDMQLLARSVSRRVCGEHVSLRPNQHLSHQISSVVINLQQTSTNYACRARTFAVDARPATAGFAPSDWDDADMHRFDACIRSLEHGLPRNPRNVLSQRCCGVDHLRSPLWLGDC